jgi:serine/threonine protein kinase
MSTLQKELLLRHNYHLGVQLGKGSYGTVFVCTELTTNQAFAVKVLTLSQNLMEDSTARKRILQEIEVMRRLNHPFVVQLHRVITEEPYLFLIMELVFGIDLYDLIFSKKERGQGGLEEDMARNIFMQLCIALNYMHTELKIIHRDVKPENILICNQHQDTVVKLVDFGLSKIESSTAHSFVGTSKYIAP